MLHTPPLNETKMNVYGHEVVPCSVVTETLSFAAPILQELRMQVLQGMCDILNHISQNLHSLLSSKLRPTVNDSMRHLCLKEGKETRRVHFFLLMRQSPAIVSLQ